MICKSEKLMQLSEKKAIQAFKKAAINIPAYQIYLKQNNISHKDIDSLEHFKERVPILNKEKTFKLYSNEIKKLCRHGELKDVKNIIPSSGHSGSFSFGLNTKCQIKQSQREIDNQLDSIFKIRKKRTLLINALPMGVRINSALTTVIDTSVRSDIVLATIRTFKGYFDQIIIIAENSFAKKILEEGQEQAINWKGSTVHLILGEEILPENLRSYFAYILGSDLDSKQPKNIIGSSFGLAEFGLNIFFETLQTIRLRRIIQRDERLKKILIGNESNYLPMILQYNPLKIFVEEIKVDSHSHLVLTNLDPRSIIPLIRYDIEDDGNVIAYEKLKEILFSLNYKEYLPPISLPVVIVWGRHTLKTPENFIIRAELIKEALYENFEIAKTITGYFRISILNNELKIEVQLRRGESFSAELEQNLKNTISKYLPIKTKLILYKYSDFPYAMELDYERKFEYFG